MSDHWRNAERARARRPISSHEVAGLEALGNELRLLRRDSACLSRSQLGVRAELSARQIEQIERGIRRTRRSTLERIVAGLLAEQTDHDTQIAVVDRLAELAGPALAPESQYRDRVERRRRRRWGRRLAAGTRIDRDAPPTQS